MNWRWQIVLQEWSKVNMKKNKSSKLFTSGKTIEFKHSDTTILNIKPTDIEGSSLHTRDRELLVILQCVIHHITIDDEIGLKMNMEPYWENCSKINISFSKYLWPKIRFFFCKIKGIY